MNPFPSLCRKKGILFITARSDHSDKAKLGPFFAKIEGPYGPSHGRYFMLPSVKPSSVTQFVYAP